MSLISTNGLLGSRGVEAIAGAETLFSQPGGISADALAAQLSSLVPLDLLDRTSEGANPADPAADPAGQEVVAAVADLVGPGGSAASASGAQAAAAQPGSPIVNLGESLTDLGHDSGRTLAADVAYLPGELTGLNASTGNVADALTNIGYTTRYAGQFVNDIADTAGEAGSQPATGTANQVVRDFHLLLEGVTHDTGLTHVTHGITNLGEVVGLGKIGDDNLLTDALALPGTVLAGGDVLASVGHLSGHLADVTDAISGIVTAVPLDLGSSPFGTGLLGQDGIVGGTGLDLANLGQVLGQNGGGPLGAVGGLVENVADGLDLVGSGAAGTGNLVTDALRLPGEVLAGNGTPSLTDAGHQLDVTLTATGDLVQTVIGGSDVAGQSPDGSLGNVVGAVDAFGDTGGPAIGIPLTLDGVGATAGALLDGASTNGLVGGLHQTVQGALTDVSNDAALAGFGIAILPDAIALPATGGVGADSLVGSLAGTASPPAVAAGVPDLLGGGAGLDGVLTPVAGLLGTEQDGHHAPGHGFGLL